MRQGDAGFTLAETAIVITIFSLILAGLISLYVSQTRMSSGQVKKVQARVELVNALNALRPYVLSADAILPSATIASGTYTSTASTLTFSLPSITSSGSTIANTFDIVALYKSTSNDLVLDLDAAASSSRTDNRRIIAPDINEVLFSYQNASLPATSTWIAVTVSRTITTSTGVETIQHDLRTELRNK